MNAMLDYELPPTAAYGEEPNNVRVHGRPNTGAGTQEVKKPTGLTLTWVCDLRAATEGRYLVKGLIPVGGLGVIYGESNCGKTFFALDLAIAIATGQSWLNRRVNRTAVVYIAGEGKAGIENRIVANQRSGRLNGSASLAITNRAANFLQTAGDVGDLIDLVKNTHQSSGDACGLIIVDTLHRAMPGGSDNDPEDMGQLIANADYVRQQTGAAVWFIHHAGKDPTKGARGHSSLRAAVDTEVLVEGQSGTRKATVTKQRDFGSGDVFAFDLETVELGTDSDGDPVTSCVVKHSEVSAATKQKIKASGKNQASALVALREWARVNPDKQQVASNEFHELMKAQNIPANRKPEVLNFLCTAGVFISSVGGYVVNKDAL